MATRNARTPAQKADLAYASIRRAIMEQALPPGTRLPEDQLGVQFGVSRTLIRAVLGRLSAEALVQIGNKRTATVAQPSLEEARAVFEVRRCLEAQAVSMVIERWQPDMGATLEGHLREEQQAARVGAKSVSIRLAGEFHTRLARMTGNPLLERYLAEVVTRCSLILAMYGRPHSTECACAEHQQLIEAFRARDTVRAVQLMQEHLHGIERRALLPDVELASAGLTHVLSRYAAELAASDITLPLKSAKRVPSPVPHLNVTKRSSS
jgi:DNA-binding GntR family transcriptional regulator